MNLCDDAVFVDEDGGMLAAAERFGFGYPSYRLRVSQEGDEGAMHLTREQAAELIVLLAAFINKPRAASGDSGRADR